MEPETGAGAFETFSEPPTRLTGLPGDRVDGEIEHSSDRLAEFLGTERATVFGAAASPPGPSRSRPA